VTSSSTFTPYDVIVVGAGAAGLMAAGTAFRRGKTVLVLEHTDKIGEKIRISGGGRCNFTNIHTKPENFISDNPHFIKSALARFTPQDFIGLVEAHGIAYHEKTLGQLFCDGSAKQIIQMLLNPLKPQGKSESFEVKTSTTVQKISKNSDHTHSFEIKTTQGTFHSTALIIATGGLSIPQIGASSFGYEIAQQFGLALVPTRPALVPLTVSNERLKTFQGLSGVSAEVIATVSNPSFQPSCSFREHLLFTHRGLSGPAILQISSYLADFSAHPSQEISINLLPQLEISEAWLDRDAQKNLTQLPQQYLKTYLTNRLIDELGPTLSIPTASLEGKKKITDLTKAEKLEIAEKVHHFKVKIEGTEGYRKAEVTAGGVDTRALSSKTMECHAVPNLFFIGEVVDVTGWLGGYNFQWAWSSGFSAGMAC
jgi:predicted Rossmann fold flavoprotein